jgi:hypothetical protein
MRGLALVVAALLGSITMLTLGATAASAEPRSEELDFVARINALRVSQGLVPLTVDAHLTDIARSWSARMVGDGAISHNPDLAGQVGGNGWRTLGENVGVGSSVDWLENAFENSPHHYANLVDPDYRWIGLGVVESGGQVWVTEDFEQPKTVVSAATSTKPAAAAPKAVAAPRPAAPKPAAPKPATPKVAAAPKAVAPKPAAPPTTSAPVTVPSTTPPTTSAPAPNVLAMKDGGGGAPLVHSATGTTVGTPLVLVALGLLVAAGLGLRRRLIAR